VSTVDKSRDEDVNDVSVVDDDLNQTSENGETKADEKTEVSFFFHLFRQFALRSTSPKFHSTPLKEPSMDRS
jgi:hypothetical protein